MGKFTPSASELNKPCCPSNERRSNESPRSREKSSCPTLTQIESTPVPTTEGSRKTDPVKEVTPGGMSPTSPFEPNIEVQKSSRTSKKCPSEEEQMDSQLESIVRGYNQEPILSPKR